jgi:hypothetical protein
MDNLRTMKRFLLFATLVCCAGAFSAQTDCTTPYDSNGDGAVTISDLLDWLGLFGDPDSDVDGICDNVDAYKGRVWGLIGLKSEVVFTLYLTSDVDHF